MTDVSFCKSCGAAIRWYRTLHGKAMPVDVHTVANGNITIVCDPFADDGGEVATVVTSGVGTHVSHFATCPNAKQHRRR